MDENNQKKGKIGLIIGIVTAVVVIVAVALVLLLRKDEAYRIIKVYEVDGLTLVNRENKGELEAYGNMVLQSGDNVFVKEGTATLKLDEDKYIYAEEQTKFTLIATGTSENSKTRIELTDGAITNEIQNKLSDNSSYEINTQNSNMSVRGTIYRVSVYKDEEGTVYAKLWVFDGEVATRLVDDKGNEIGEEVFVPVGKEITVYQNEEITDYLTEVEDIDYSELPPEVIEYIIEKMETEDIVLPVTKEELQGLLNSEEATGPFTVTFVCDGQTFGSQVVEKDGFATEPTLMPSESGSWDFDFNQPITEDVVIEWKR